jgi:hypothetical protein
MGGVFSDGTPVWGRGTPGVVVGVAQNDTVECEKVHRKRASIGAAESTPGYQPSAWPGCWFIPKVLEAGWGDAYDAPPFFRGMAG